MSGGSGSGEIPDGYDESAYFTISSVSDADTFSSRFHHSTDSSIPSYYDSTTGTTLALGNRININDGTYNTQWMIAGFDVEYNRTATDGITYNNGYGIALIPVVNLGSHMLFYYKKSGTAYTTAYYTGTYFYRSVTSTMVNALKTVLGTHLIQRDVLLSQSENSVPSYYSSWSAVLYCPQSYAWTTSYLTSMSVYQVLGESALSTTLFTYGSGTYGGDTSSYAKILNYDIGEANYKLPVFDTTNAYNGYPYYIRGERRRMVPHSDDNDYYYSYISMNGSSNSIYLNNIYCDGTSYVSGYANIRPMIYIR